MIKLEIQAETIPELVKQVQELAKNFNLENVSRTTIVKPKIETREAVEVTKAPIKEEPKKETNAEVKKLEAQIAKLKGADVKVNAVKAEEPKATTEGTSKPIERIN